MEIWMYAALVVFFASSLQAATGFGVSVIATPILILIFDAVTAIQVNIVLSILLSAIMLFKVAKDVNLGLLLNLTIGSMLGVPVGIVAFLYFDDSIIKMIMGILVIFLLIVSIFSFKLTRTSGRDAVTGVFSGA